MNLYLPFTQERSVINKFIGQFFKTWGSIINFLSSQSSRPVPNIDVLFYYSLGLISKIYLRFKAHYTPFRLLLLLIHENTWNALKTHGFYNVWQSIKFLKLDCRVGIHNRLLFAQYVSIFGMGSMPIPIFKNYVKVL